jgi:glycosyltransferase involved in cell wall biosynthesis
LYFIVFWSQGMVCLTVPTHLVSVLICVRNSEKYIGDCIASILQQTFTDFELVIVDDFSSDNTGEMIKSFKDKRIIYLKNEQWLGITRSRNACIRHANGEYLFFTDGDCIVSKDWIEQGLKNLKDCDCVGVEGKTYYVSKNYQPTFSDHSCESHAGDYMTGNVAYKKTAVIKIRGFDERYTCHEDRDFGLRILQFGKIHFNANMLVYVQQQTLTPREYVKRSNAIKNRVYLFKRFHDTRCIAWRFVDPISLGMIIFPALVFTSLLSYRFRTIDDFKLVPFKYVNLVCSRLQLWSESAKERVLLI